MSPLLPILLFGWTAGSCQDRSAREEWIPDHPQGDEEQGASNDGNGTQDSDGADHGESSQAGDSDPSSESDSVPKFDIGESEEDSGMGDGDCDEQDLPTPNATLRGVVYAPNMELPISGALVYLTNKPVSAVPDGVYCAECVELDCVHHVLTEPDGSFELPAVAGAGQKLVVQKGQFLHVVDFDVKKGNNEVQPEESNLPSQWNPSVGTWIPRIAVYRTSPDEVFNVLAKFGLGEVDANGVLVPGTEQFALIDAQSDQGKLMDQLDEMSRYHVIFVPCGVTAVWNGTPAVAAQRVENVRDYVAAGGKWYATDHSNEYISEPFPGYQDFHNAAMPDLQPSYDVSGEVRDDRLLSWLDALPEHLKDIGGGSPTLHMLPNVRLQLNYSGIDAVHEVLVENDDGDLVNVGHHIWVEGPCTSCAPATTIRPMAVSGQYGCGRMMYSTFENSSTPHRGLNPQELILLYMILEISVCHTGTPPDPPVE